tara:strand:+ start:4603 stop:5253 length:651 start_codon:yes stop_codon:yes gene_type:complete
MDVDMDIDEPDISEPPHNFIQMLNSLIRNNNIIFRAELENIEENISHTNSGCSEEFINNLDEFAVDEEFLKKNLQCSICLDDFKEGDKYILLPCKDDPHYFHSGCESCSGIKEWLKRKNTCPMCRTEFPTENMTNEPILSGSGRTMDIFESITIHTSMTPPVDNTENDNREDNLNNPNNLENTISNIITNYINDIEESNEQRDIQLAIQASLNELS